MDEPRLPLLIFIASLVIFATHGMVVVGIESLNGSQIVLFRAALGFVFQFICYLLVSFKHREHHAPILWVYMAISGTFAGMMWSSQYVAFKLIGVGPTSMIYCLGPALVVVFASFVFRDKLTANRIIGLALALLGSMALSIYGLSGGDSLIGYGYAILMAVSFSIMITFNKLADGIRGLESTATQIGFATLAVAIFLLLTGDFPTYIAPDDVIPLLYLGLVSGGLGAMMYFAAIKYLSAPTVAICDYLEPMIAVVLAAVVLGESFGIIDLFGTVLIIVGAVIAVLGFEVFRRRKNRDDGKMTG